MTKLGKFLTYVAKHNSFYQKIIKEYGITDPSDITQYPILTRQKLQENRCNMFSEGYKTKYISQQLLRQTSSGTSGIPINVYWEYKDWYASNLCLWRRRLRWYGIHPNDKYVKFTFATFNIENDGENIYYINEPKNVLTVNVSLIQDEQSYKKLAELINEFNPKWLYIQPFILNKLIQIYKEYNLEKPSELKYIETVGEVLSSDLKTRAIEFFKVQFANMYGSEEMNGIAYECPYNQMHVMEDNVFVELTQKEDGGEPEAIITNLNNLAMPLIRYNQGDDITIKRLVKPCRCGSIEPIIKTIKGRSFESINVDGVELNAFMLLEVMSEVNNLYGGIVRSYRYIYTKATKTLSCIVELDINRKVWGENVKKTIQLVFEKKVKTPTSINFEIVYENDVRIGSGKHKVFVIKE